MRADARLFCMSVMVAVAACPNPLDAAGEAREFLARIDVRLTTAPTLSQSARASMIDEATAIWQRQGIVIEWLPPATAAPVGPGQLRALIVERGVIARPRIETVAVGELVRPLRGYPVALISIEGARHLVSSVSRRAGNELIAVDQRRLGIVLGRALAHEIGHYLLDTHTHARSGLMRPNFDALEFTDPRDGTFALDRDAAAWLRTRDAEKFVYAQR